MFKLLSFIWALNLFFQPSNYEETYFDIAKSKLEIYNPPNKDYVVIIDYRQDVYSKRLYLLDMVNQEVILNSTVTHARKSGLLCAEDFSNVVGSNKSSAGGFITKHSRQGNYGYSMVIAGLDKDENDNVEKRYIIFHPTTSLWSKGCFATSRTNNKTIIDYMKGGRLIYVIR
jgi:hypothetical protein